MVSVGITALSKADTFRSVKTSIAFEQYLGLVKNHKHRIPLSHLRLSSHPLMIEKGSHRKHPLTRPERKCPFCRDHIEDECHFVINCPLYNTERGNLFKSVINNSTSFNDIPSDYQKFIFILTNEDPIVLRDLALFTYKAFQIRNRFLEN